MNYLTSTSSHKQESIGACTVEDGVVRCCVHKLAGRIERGASKDLDLQSRKLTANYINNP